MKQFGQRPAIARGPSSAFVGASWLALGIGMLSYVFGIWGANMTFDVKAFYITMLLYGLFSAVSLQKTVRDRLEGIPSTSVYFGLCWVSVGACLMLLTVSLWNAEMEPAVKGFFAMAYSLSLFAAVAVQKNVRDLLPLTTDVAPDAWHGQA